MQELTVEALMNENRALIFQAAMLDPHTAAELDLDQNRAITKDLIKAHGKMLPEWKYS